MWELFTHPSNIVFSVCLCLMFLCGLFEVCLTLLGGGSQGFLDQFIPEDIGHQAEVGVDAEYSLVGKTLDWLYVGKIPLFVWLIIFLTIYSLSGFILQSIFFEITHTMLSGWIISPACLFLCMPLVRFSAKLITKILPQDETTAIHSNDLIGLTGVIILGEARANYPAEAKVTDIHGLTHYVLVEPKNQDVFTTGQSVVLTQKTKVGYQAQASTLLDH